MMQSFRAYQMATALYQKSQTLKLKGPIKNQFERAILSIPLNLAEGCAKTSIVDRKRFYEIALGSLREVQAIIDLQNLTHIQSEADRLGATLFCLVRSLNNHPATDT